MSEIFTNKQHKLRQWQRRSIILACSMLFIIASVVITLFVFRDNVVFFFSPTEILSRPEYEEKLIRVGGIIKEGSVQYSNDRQKIEFIITDFENEVKVTYHGFVPSLFKEGSGTVVLGKMSKGIFLAEELLAKHDENYMPKEVADTLKKKEQSQCDL